MNHLPLLLLGLALAGSAGCVSSAKVVQANPSPGAAASLSPGALAAPECVWVLNPKLTYEHVQNETTLDAAAFKGPEIAKKLTEAALVALKSRGIQAACTDTESNFPADLKAQAEEASASGNRLFLSRPDPQVLQAIQKLGGASARAAALVQYVRVKVGPGGWYDPVFTGEFTTSSSSAHLRAALVDCQSGNILWQNSVLLRELPKPASDNLAKALQQLYSTLHIKP